jgi:hypothetical protein
LKFGKLLSLREEEARLASQSLCQNSPRVRDFSQFLSSRSKSKEKLEQLEEVCQLRRDLSNRKFGIEFKNLLEGLCMPEEGEEHDSSNGETTELPSKMLISNPYLNEGKKKKKKKKK